MSKSNQDTFTQNPHHDAPVIFKEGFQYETLSFRGRLDVLDKDGRVAVFRRRQRIRFLEDNVSTFFDRIWGEGVLFANYYARQMRILDSISTRQGYVLVLNLPRSFRKGETFEVETERRIVGGFLTDAGYWDSRMAAPTTDLQIEVHAHPSRSFANPDFIGPRSGYIRANHTERSLTLQVRRPALETTYTVAWAWK